MKLRGLVSLFAACMPLVCAGQSDFVKEQMHGRPPLHPTLLLTSYKGKEEPIMDVRVDEPEVEVDNKLHGISLRASFQPIRGASFAPGSVKVTDQHAGSRFIKEVIMFSNGDEVSGGDWDHHSDYEATLTPSESYKDCYMAVLFFDAAFIKGNESSTKVSVVFHEIGDLVAGKPRKVQVRFGYMEPDEKNPRTFFPLIFTHGLEIESNHSDYSALFFRRLELTRHEQIMADYKAKNVGKDMPLKPYVRVMPKFPNSLDLGKLPAVTKASFMVDEDGTVYSIQLDEDLNKEAATAIHDALRGWLFFPRLKEGRAERTMVRVPIQLHPEAKAAPAAG